MAINYTAAIGADTLTDQDLQSLEKLNSITSVTPLSTISALAPWKAENLTASL